MLFLQKKSREVRIWSVWIRCWPGPVDGPGREVKDLVRQGRVRIDGVTARTAEEKLDPDAAAISVDGQPGGDGALYLCDAP